MLHIGGARSALFNYLYARNKGGKFLLRVEDTDKSRSTEAAKDALIDGLKWLGLDWDGEIYFQSAYEARHREVAEALLKKGEAYYCYCTAEELTAMREEAERKGEGFKYDRRWRDSTATPPAGVKPSVRIKAPLSGDMLVKDHVQGEVRFPATELDDFIILRSDGTPTYNLAVVVDDHDMGVTHIIRGDDHLNNAGRQSVIYQAMGWSIPEFAHIPLIHGPDGAKLSKRRGATGVGEYAAMGYLPEAMRNYLVRLGWSHGDDEMFDDAQAIAWFNNLGDINKAPARLDFAKLNHVNAHYMRLKSNAELAELVANFLPQAPDSDQRAMLAQAMEGLNSRASTLVELAESARFYLEPIAPDEKAKQALDKGREGLRLVHDALRALPAPWDAASVKQAITKAAETGNRKLGELMPPTRAAIVGSMTGPDIPEAIAILGREEALARIEDALAA
jgi:glutamyl-tRNA synthetase